MYNNQYHIIMRLKHFFISIIGTLLIASCVGEDVEEGNIELSLTSDNLFSIGINENNANTLQLKTTLDGDENFSVEWSSSNPRVIDVSNTGKLVLSTDEDQIGKSTSISAKAFKKGETTSIAELAPRELNLGLLTIKALDVSGISEAQKNDLLNFGFEEKLNKKNNLTSIDLTDTTQKLEVAFTNFNKETIDAPSLTWNSSDISILEVDSDGVLTPKIKSDTPVVITATLAASETKRNLALSEVFTVVVSDETVVVDPPNPDPNSGKTLIGSGMLQANNGYNSMGGFEILRDSNGVVTLEFDANFLAPIPDREMYASNTIGNDVSNARLIAKNHPRSGAQTYTIDFDITNFKYIYIFCAGIRSNAGFGEIKK